MTEFSKFPEEMALQILSRMPPKSLMRFKCVRKSWYTLIKSPSFVSKHLFNSLHNKQSTCIFCKRYVFRDIATKDVESVISLITFSNDDVGDNDHEHISHSVIQDIDLPLSMSGVPKNHVNEPELLGAVYITGHCDGIICLVHGEIVLWNPAIKQFKVLPKPLLTNGIVNSIGFGYDPRSKDYKVFSFPTHDEDRTSERDFNYPPQVEVYSLSTDSWTEINADHLETETTNLYPEYFQMNFKGIWYWTGSEQQKEFMVVYDSMDEEWVRQLIIVFDMNDQVFEDILFPYSLYHPMIPYLEMRVIVWNESVALFGQYRFGYADDAFGLWVMDDIVKGSWTKQLTLEVIVGTRMTLEMWKSDEILMVANDNRIFSFNFRTEEIKFLPIESTHPTFSAAIVCINSIVPVIHGRQQA
ncbi:putative F-box protein At1g70960 [Rosa rugosa]|uniref:putative F-box protein At1g70960 n=1 Tax=Rosa rugosa TaxID=74645 RepID=UPI002B4166F9|nr:putative F-box protein At1g70960 [Rosa rugosa]